MVSRPAISVCFYAQLQSVAEWLYQSAATLSVDVPAFVTTFLSFLPILRRMCQELKQEFPSQRFAKRVICPFPARHSTLK